MQKVNSKEYYQHSSYPLTGLTRLVLHKFRNYQDLDLYLQGNCIVLTGPNGAGKTNILEAISFLSPGRGLRHIKLSQVTNLKVLNQKDSPLSSWAVAATLGTQEDTIELGTGLDYTATGSERRLVKINGQVAKSQALLTNWISVNWVTPQMDRLFLEGASVRRKFIDRLIYAIDPMHAERLHRYEHHMKERAHLLREGRYDPLWISALERRLAEDGVAIAVARQQLVKYLEEAQHKERDYPFPQFRAEMKGEVETWLEDHPALVVEDMYAEKLEIFRRQDAETGGAFIGPHRSDFCVHHLAKQLQAEVCSTGEQKMLLLALTLAFNRVQREYCSCPAVLLLDDVAAHLDDQHRRVLFQEICAPAGEQVSEGPKKGNFQVWMTGTDKSMFHHLNGQAQFLTVHHATLKEDF